MARRAWHFDVTLHNLSGVPATYELSSQALSEIVDGGFFTQHSADWRGKGVEITYSGAASASAEGATVTVPASGEATVGIDVTPGSEFASYVADNAPNGTFLDGFVRFASKTEGQPDLAVPTWASTATGARPPSSMPSPRTAERTPSPRESTTR